MPDRSAKILRHHGSKPKGEIVKPDGQPIPFVKLTETKCRAALSLNMDDAECVVRYWLVLDGSQSGLARCGYAWAIKKHRA
jgi:hypothetical protein